MFVESDLQFLRDIFEKCHIRTSLLSYDDSIGDVLEGELCRILGIEKNECLVSNALLGTNSHTIIKLVGHLGLTGILIPMKPALDKCLFVGPFLSSPASREEISDMAQGLGISQRSVRHFCEFFASIPTLSPRDSVFSVVGSFCERLWGASSYSVVDFNINLDAKSPIMVGDGVDDALNIKALEMRYKYENELMDAVTRGQIHKEAQLIGHLSEPWFERRVADPVRNMKNYCIIMNTLLRKAAERGGVHPIFLDSASSSFAKKIEQLTSGNDGSELMCEMFRAYCRLVRKHSLKNYSPAVGKAIIAIDSELSSDLSLTSLAAKQNISPGYLSAVFKKDTGKTVSEYIREKRIAHAAHLLKSTNLQIQTVALNCGIMDVQYFSKLFKRETGKTPREYRESIKQS